MKITELKKARIASELLQKEVAKKAQKSIRTYQEYEAGERIPDAHTAQRLARALEAKVEDLFPLPSEETSPLQKTHQNNSTKTEP